MLERMRFRTVRLKVKLAGRLTGNCGKVIEPVSLTYQQKRKKKKRKYATTQNLKEVKLKQKKNKDRREEEQIHAKIREEGMLGALSQLKMT